MFGYLCCGRRHSPKCWLRSSPIQQLALLSRTYSTFCLSYFRGKIPPPSKLPKTLFHCQTRLICSIFRKLAGPSRCSSTFLDLPLPCLTSLLLRQRHLIDCHIWRGSYLLQVRTRNFRAAAWPNVRRLSFGLSEVGAPGRGVIESRGKDSV